MRFYLSGGMEYAQGEGRDWRVMLQDWLERELQASVFNPNVESDRLFSGRYHRSKFPTPQNGRSASIPGFIAAELVDLDCGEIAEHTDAVICYWDE